MDMICMFMGNKDRIDTGGFQTKSGKSFRRFLDGEAQIDDNTGVPVINQGTVTFTATTQGSKSH
jgi:hypothetical protein